MDASNLLALLRRRLLSLMLCVALGLGVAALHATTAEPSYTAVSRTLINIPAARGIQEALAGAQLSGQLLSTYAQIATSRTVATAVTNSLGLSESADELRSRLTSAPVQDTFLIDIAATDSDPNRATAIANATAAAFGRAVAKLEVGKGEAIQVQLLDAAAVPTTRTSPRSAVDLSIGLIAGLLVGLTLALLRDSLDRSIKTPSQGSHSLHAPMLGLVPRRRGGLDLVAASDELSPEAEALRALRTALRFFDPDRPSRVFLVTSPGAGEGKSSLTANLAITLARAGERVVVVDADLRRATLTAYFGLERAVGLSTVIARTSELSESIQPWSTDVAVLPAGALPPNPSELLGSQYMASLLDSLSVRYDVVLLDAPPVLPVTDAVVLAAQADAVLIVLRYGRTTRTAAAEAQRRITAVGGTIAGFVLNAVPATDSRNYYAAYGYESLVTSPAAPAPQRRSTPEPTGTAD